MHPPLPRGRDPATTWARPKRTFSNPGTLTAAHTVVMPGVARFIEMSRAELRAANGFNPRRFAHVVFKDANEKRDTEVTHAGAPDGRHYTPQEMQGIQRATVAAPCKLSSSVQALAAHLSSDPPGFGLASNSNSAFATPLRNTFGTGTPPPSEGRVLFGSAATTPGSALRRGPRTTSQRVMSVLNKVTEDLDKFAGLRDELLALPYAGCDADELDEVVGVFFRKAVQEPRYSNLYARLAAALTQTEENVRPSEGTSVEARLRLALVGRCQSAFEEAVPAAVSDSPAASDDTAVRQRRRGNLRFIAELYLHRVVAAGVLDHVLRCLIAEPASGGAPTTPGGRPPLSEQQAELLLVPLRSAGAAFARTPRGAALLPRIAAIAARDAPQHSGGRARCLLLDVADAVATALVDAPPLPAPVNPPPTVQAAPAVDTAAQLMTQLAHTGDYEGVLRRLLEADAPAVLAAWFHRAMTAVRCDHERRQLPPLLEFLVLRKVLAPQEATALAVRWAHGAIDRRDWEGVPKLWRHWAQVLAPSSVALPGTTNDATPVRRGHTGAGDQSDDDDAPRRVPLLNQQLHNVAFEYLCAVPGADPADLALYIRHVVPHNAAHAWGVPPSPADAPRFHYLAHLVRCSARDELPDRAAAIVRDSGVAAVDIEAQTFLAALGGDTAAAFDALVEHPRLLSPLMAMRIAGAVVAAHVAAQDETYRRCLDLLRVAVDIPERGLAEALVLTEVLEAGTLMADRVAHCNFGYRLMRSLREAGVVSLAAIGDARSRAQGRGLPDNLVQLLLGPLPG